MSITRLMTGEEYSRVIAALCEGMYAAYLDYPALLSREEVLSRALASVDEVQGGLLVNVLASGYTAGYLAVAQEDGAHAREYAALLASCSRRSALALVRAACTRLFPAFSLTLCHRSST